MNIPYLHTGETKLMLQVKADLERHEGYRQYAYPDPLSHLAKTQRSSDWGYRPAREIMLPGTPVEEGRPWTVGFGFTNGVTADSQMTRIQSERKLEEHILDMKSELGRVLPWFPTASFVTQTILINMAFNMGLLGLLKFKNTLRYIKEGNYAQAAANMKQSLWYRQTGSRAVELVRRMADQEIPVPFKAPERIV